jgi:hypothetical protein
MFFFISWYFPNVVHGSWLQMKWTRNMNKYFTVVPTEPGVLFIDAHLPIHYPVGLQFKRERPVHNWSHECQHNNVYITQFRFSFELMNTNIITFMLPTTKHFYLCLILWQWLSSWYYFGQFPVDIFHLVTVGSAYEFLWFSSVSAGRFKNCAIKLLPLLSFNSYRNLGRHR